MANDNLKQILAQLKDHEERIGTLEKKVNLSQDPFVAISLRENSKKGKLSLGEFLVSKKPSDDVKRTLAIGYYLEKIEGLVSFNVGDLLAAYERAREKKPLNINDKVNMNIKKGHMDLAKEKKDSKKSWYITNSGEQFVEIGFKE